MFTFNQNTYEIHLTRGDTLTLDFQFDGEGLSEGDKLYFTVKKSASDSRPLIEKEATLLDEQIGRVVFSSGDTSVLPFGRYAWDLRVFYANGEVTSPIAPAAFFVDAVVGRSDPGGDIKPDETRYDGDYTVTPKMEQSDLASLFDTQTNYVRG